MNNSDYSPVFGWRVTRQHFPFSILPDRQKYSTRKDVAGMDMMSHHQRDFVKIVERQFQIGEITILRRNRDDPARERVETERDGLQAGLHPPSGVRDWRADRPPGSWGSTSGLHIRLKERAFQKRIQRVQPPGGAGALRRVRARVRGLFRDVLRIHVRRVWIPVLARWENSGTS